MYHIDSVLSSLDHALLRDAQFLLADVLNQPVSIILSQTQTVLTPDEYEQFEIGLAQLKQGKPLAYVVGNQPFWSLDFLVNEHTLIPRQDTEHLVEQALKVGDSLGIGQLNVLDLGTGSGAIAICLKHERTSWWVTATDFSKDALAVAKKNALSNQVQVHFLQGSWFDALESNTEQYHLIVSNPPYIAPDDEHLADLTDEPMTALVADNDGMADITHIVAAATPYLHPQGWLLIEHGYNQGEMVRNCFLAQGFEQVETVKDYGGNERLTKGRVNP